MKIAKFTAAIALALGLTTFAFAGNPKTEVKSPSTTTAEAQTATAEIKWFRFEGSPGQANDPTKYVEIEQSELECENNLEGTYRCEIEIMSQGTSPDRPDLSTSVLTEYLKTNP